MTPGLQRHINRVLYTRDPDPEVKDLEQQHRKLLAEVDRVVAERDLAVVALSQIRDFTTCQIHSTSRLMREIASNALDKLEGR